ncbi:unnamed protein product [Amoebophrya sp. A25]|nr:unnamed protein product [Amoebophrya sp. A25]|eukprot:GSA25T00009300001.1
MSTFIQQTGGAVGGADAGPSREPNQRGAQPADSANDPVVGDRAGPGGGLGFNAYGNNVNVGMGIHRDGCSGNDLGGRLPPRGSSSIAGGPPSNPEPAGNRVPASPGGS